MFATCSLRHVKFTESIQTFLTDCVYFCTLCAFCIFEHLEHHHKCINIYRLYSIFRDFRYSTTLLSFGNSFEKYNLYDHSTRVGRLFFEPFRSTGCQVGIQMHFPTEVLFFASSSGIWFVRLNLSGTLCATISRGIYHACRYLTRLSNADDSFLKLS